MVLFLGFVVCLAVYRVLTLLTKNHKQIEHKERTLTTTFVIQSIASDLFLHVPGYSLRGLISILILLSLPHLAIIFVLCAHRDS